MPTGLRELVRQGCQPNPEYKCQILRWVFFPWVFELHQLSPIQAPYQKPYQHHQLSSYHQESEYQVTGR